MKKLKMADPRKGVTADANVALWRTRGGHQPLVGEFAFQVKFKRRQDVRDKARGRCAKFCIRFQDCDDVLSSGCAADSEVVMTCGTSVAPVNKKRACIAASP